jgi:hypothetical protein
MHRISLLALRVYGEICINCRSFGLVFIFYIYLIVVIIFYLLRPTLKSYKFVTLFCSIVFIQTLSGNVLKQQSWHIYQKGGVEKYTLRDSNTSYKMVTTIFSISLDPVTYVFLQLYALMAYRSSSDNLFLQYSVLTSTSCQVGFK